MLVYLCLFVFLFLCILLLGFEIDFFIVFIYNYCIIYENLPYIGAASHQPRRTSTHDWRRHGQLSIGSRSYWKSDLTDKMKRSFFQAAVVSILLYGCTTWTLTKRLERRLDGNYTRMLRAVLNKSWRQHPTRLQLYGHLPPITKTIQVRRTRHAGHCWRSKDELISDVLLWTPTHGCARVGRPARTYIQQLCEDTGCNPEDLPEAMNDREKWRETVRDIRAGGATWWWWWWYIWEGAGCAMVTVVGNGRRNEFKTWTRLFTLEESMNSTILRPVKQTGLVNIGLATSQGEGKVWI